MFKSIGELDEFNKMVGNLSKKHPQRIKFQRKQKDDTILENIISTGDRRQDIFLLLYETVPPGTTWELKHVAKIFFKHKDIYRMKKPHPVECLEVSENNIANYQTRHKTQGWVKYYLCLSVV